MFVLTLRGFYMILELVEDFLRYSPGVHANRLFRHCRSS